MAFWQAHNRCVAATPKAKHAFFHSACEKQRLFKNKLEKCTGLGKLRKISLFWPCSTPIISKASANLINHNLLQNIASFHQSSVACPNGSHPLASNAKISTFVFEFKPVSQRAMYQLLTDLPSTEGTGLDNISASIQKYIPKKLFLILTKLINTSLKFGSFSTQWKAAVVTPIYKKGKKTDIGNYRSISILRLISKVFERLINIQL